LHRWRQRIAGPAPSHHRQPSNLGPAILDRLLTGEDNVTAYVSASDTDPDHPSAKVTNALMRRGCTVYTTEDGGKWHHSADAPDRGWRAAQPLPPLDESD
jgi:hypothetical protein